jgi:hypothetical protein
MLEDLSTYIFRVVEEECLIFIINAVETSDRTSFRFFTEQRLKWCCLPTFLCTHINKVYLFIILKGMNFNKRNVF